MIFDVRAILHIVITPARILTRLWCHSDLPGSARPDGAAGHIARSGRHDGCPLASLWQANAGRHDLPTVGGGVHARPVRVQCVSAVDWA